MLLLPGHPVLTHSYHYLRDETLHARVKHALEQERTAVDGWYEELLSRSPYALAPA
jgi:predicted N-acyltransferase